LPTYDVFAVNRLRGLATLNFHISKSCQVLPVSEWRDEWVPWIRMQVESVLIDTLSIKALSAVSGDLCRPCFPLRNISRQRKHRVPATRRRCRPIHDVSLTEIHGLSAMNSRPYPLSRSICPFNISMYTSGGNVILLFILLFCRL